MNRVQASRLVVALAALLLAAVAMHATVRADRLHRIAQEALRAACSDTTREPYPEVCGPLPDAHAWCVHDWQELADKYCN